MSPIACDSINSNWCYEEQQNMELFVILLGVLLAAWLHKPDKPKDEKPEKPEVKMFPLREEVYTNEYGQTIKRTEYITPVINNYPAAWTEPNNQRE